VKDEGRMAKWIVWTNEQPTSSEAQSLIDDITTDISKISVGWSLRMANLPDHQRLRVWSAV
jgi:hypothetical protein